ncbi:MAG: heavy metal translocating P-type ATPase, partial [Phycisphaerales bacterium JB039]
AAYLFSVVTLIGRLTGWERELPLYFGESAGLLTLISLGHWLEARTTAAAGAALRELLSLQPDEVELVESAEASGGRRVLSADVRPGELFIVRPGDRIAVDGRIAKGASTVDESIITGESMPVERAEGEEVVAGSVNITGRIVVEATTDGRSTTVSRIAEMVRSAQSSKMRLQKLADRISGVFVPAVLGVALLTALGWGLLGGSWVEAVINATTVLIISCPCALGLATPTAVMAGSGAASKKGMIVKDARALERLAQVRVFLFDKTGTLTHGRPQVTDASAEALRLGAALGRGSSHPISRAIVERAEADGLEIPHAAEVHEEAGRGLRGVVDGAEVALLSRKAAEEDGLIEPSGDVGTASVVVRAGDVVGVIRLHDEPREGAAELLQRLRARGCEVGLLTGDREAVARRLGEAIGLKPEEIHADLRPDDKLALVRQRAERGVVAMIGDGVNDAAALAEAGASGGVGVAMGTGASIAVESADVVIPGERLEAIEQIADISRQTRRTILQNLFMSFIYNTLAIPAAAGGLLGVHGPLVAAGAMALSDIGVVGNSVRLKWRLGRRPRGASSEV